MVHRLLSTAALVPFLLACAPLTASSAPALTGDQAALVRATCDRVMGLAHSNYYLDQCVDSLSQSLARKVAADAMANGYEDCRAQGLSEGSAAFSTCMLDRRPRARAAQPMTLAYDAGAPENARGYFDVNNSVHWRREQYSCAQLGLTPGGAAFGQCVASLDAALFPDPN